MAWEQNTLSLELIPGTNHDNSCKGKHLQGALVCIKSGQMITMDVTQKTFQRWTTTWNRSKVVNYSG